jgi:hypothetical protein
MYVPSKGGKPYIVWSKYVLARVGHTICLRKAMGQPKLNACWVLLTKYH